jgi:hypothetical protein
LADWQHFQLEIPNGKGKMYVFMPLTSEGELGLDALYVFTRDIRASVNVLFLYDT